MCYILNLNNLESADFNENIRVRSKHLKPINYTLYLKLHICDNNYQYDD